MTWSRRSLFVLTPWLLGSRASAAEDYAAARRGMVDNIRQLLAAGAAGDIRSLDPRVVAAMTAVPRHLFVPEPLQREAYRNDALPIGHGATISQPLIVALMTHLAAPRPEHRVLEVGTGSGYQAAILSRLVREVFTIELEAALASAAAERLARLGFSKVRVRQGDGYAGWARHAPFDSILVTAGAPFVPPALVQQLKAGGRLVIPVGPRSQQQLTLIEKDRSGRTRESRTIPVNFVPLRPAKP